MRSHKGSFNDWSSSSIPLLKKNGIWTVSISLEPGEYAYQFVVDGYPMPDPHNKSVFIEKGEVHSKLIVK